MNAHRPVVAALTAVILVGGYVLAGSGQSVAPPQLPLAPLGGRGEAVFAAFEGWGPTKDGGNVLLLGYFNRNTDQVLDIPIGPNNRIEPGGPDAGQPTYFDTRRRYGVFAIPIPRDFGAKRMTWTIVANGQTTAISFGLTPPYFIDFYKNHADGNEPPILRFSEIGPGLQGPPPRQHDVTLSAAVGQPLPLAVWVSDQPSTYKPPQVFPAGGRGGRGGRGGEPQGDIDVTFAKYRGPAGVTFSQERVSLVTKGDPKLVLKAETTASFAEPGEYWLMVTANDESGVGGGGDQCCWTTGHIRVNVE